jgi:hypothetical protein
MYMYNITAAHAVDREFVDINSGEAASGLQLATPLPRAGNQDDVSSALGLALECLWRFWRPPGFVFAALGPLGDPMGSLACPLGVPWGSLWVHLGRLGVPWGSLWGLLGRLGVPRAICPDFFENWTPNSEQMCLFARACA